MKVSRKSRYCFSHLPSSWWGPFCRTTLTSVGSAKVTKPKPLDRPDSLFFITTQSMTSPYLEKYRCKFSWEVSHDRPPTNSFLDQKGAFRYYTGLERCISLIKEVNEHKIHFIYVPQAFNIKLRPFFHDFN